MVARICRTRWRGGNGFVAQTMPPCNFAVAGHTLPLWRVRYVALWWAGAGLRFNARLDAKEGMQGSCRGMPRRYCDCGLAFYLLLFFSFCIKLRVDLQPQAASNDCLAGNRRLRRPRTVGLWRCFCLPIRLFHRSDPSGSSPQKHRPHEVPRHCRRRTIRS